MVRSLFGYLATSRVRKRRQVRRHHLRLARRRQCRHRRRAPLHTRFTRKFAVGRETDALRSIIGAFDKVPNVWILPSLPGKEKKRPGAPSRFCLQASEKLRQKPRRQNPKGARRSAERSNTGKPSRRES